MYVEALTALEQSGLGHLARHSSWAYVVANLAHVLGAALLVGAIAVYDLRLISGRGEGLAATGRVAIPLAATGLALQLPSGIMLLAPEASALGINPAFYVKLGFMALGLANLAFFHARLKPLVLTAQGSAIPAAAKLTAVVSLTAWIIVLLAGRMIAYL